MPLGDAWSLVWTGQLVLPDAGVLGRCWVSQRVLPDAGVLRRWRGYAPCKVIRNNPFTKKHYLQN